MDTDEHTPEPQPAEDRGTKTTTPPSTGRERATPEGDALDPTRYGDWEKNGRCIDF